ncbi:SDR family oxidoreductase [Yaniella flava]|uniref:SDR family oxidoreductase n=1 Tax=Yaniella flava TaxID=287930 RepID=A0ABN2UWB1_9MICC
MTNALDFTDKTVIITGAASGIGRATARLLADNGAKIVIGDVDDQANETVDLITHGGGTAQFVKTDVTSAADVQNLVQTAVDTHGRIDVAFNNAGILPPVARFVDQTEKDFDKTIAVDLKGVFLSLKYEIEAMLKTGGGAIINTASVAGLIADPDMAPYVAAKHGVVGLTRSAAYDHGKDGIRVNALAPGLVETGMTEVWRKDPEKWDAVTSNNFLNKAASPEEIAGMVLFLASDLAGFATGGVYPVDGGQTAR